MPEHQDNPHDDVNHVNVRRFEDFLRKLPLPDLQTELENLDEPLDEGRNPPFGLPRCTRSDLAFRSILRRLLEDPINNTRKYNAAKAPILPEIRLLRLAASHIALHELEHRIRSYIARLEDWDDPDVSPMQNLVSELVFRAKTVKDEVSAA